jgi:hypothetical protein
MGDLSADGQKSDPLRRRGLGRFVILATLLVAGVAFFLGAGRPDPNRLPGIALDSPFLLDLERAAVVSAVISGFMIFAIRGWDGYFPSKLSTSGAEYGERGIGNASETSMDLGREVRKLTRRQLSLAAATRVTLDDFVDEIEAIKRQLPQSEKDDDML